MDFGIIDYCLQPTPFFDVPAPGAADDFARVSSPLPDGWLRTGDDVWSYQHPAAVTCREQGWKVHVSATPDDAEKVLEIVWSLCLARDLPFKFLRSRRQVVARNSKYADRTASGKFMALYPQDDAELPGLLADLDVALAGFDGPAVLTDLRYREAPVFVRYGAFVELSVPGPDGGPVPAMRRPDGVLVPDVRKPGFHTPDWVELPECLADSVRRRESVTPLPFRVTRALHFSNGGGVYDAVERDGGRRVLLKEARPMAGLDEDGRDAVARLEQERWALEALAGAPYVPALVEHLRGDAHYYLARDFVDGESLLSAVQRRHPFLPGPREMDPAGYAQWALTVGERVAAALTDMHARGVAFGDVHPNNVLLDADDRPTFIDLETASRVADDLPQRIGAPGFRAPDSLRGAAADRYGLACLRLSLLLPATITLSWGAGKARELLAEIHARFDGGEPGSVVPLSFDDAVLADLGAAAGTPPEPKAEAAADADRVVAFTLASATPERTDRLYPGAATQFRLPGGGVTPAYGASGVLWALQRRGEDVPAAHLDWLARALPSLRCPVGLFEGRGGLALVLRDLGLRDEASAQLGRVLEEVGAPARERHEAPVEVGLARGLAGAGLAALLGEDLLPEAAGAALAIGDELIATQAWTASATRRGTPAWGLLDGPAGIAAFLVRLHGRFGMPDHLRAAHAALAADLDRLFPGGGWSLPLSEPVAPGPWLRPTLHRGSAGAAIVAADLLDAVHALRSSPSASAAADAVLTADEVAGIGCALDRLGTAHDLWHHEQPGLFTGRAGMIAALRRVGGRWPDSASRIAAQVRLLDLYRVEESGVVGYLGDHGLKLSCDLGTGSAGVVWVAEGGTVPFLG